MSREFILLTRLAYCCKKHSGTIIRNFMAGMMLFLLTVASSISPLKGQSLEELIGMAQQNNPSLQVLEGNYEAAKYLGDQVASYPDPQVGLGLGVFPVETRLGAQQVKLGVSQRLLWKGELSTKRNLADAKAEVMAFHSENMMIVLAYQIKRSYYALVFLDNTIDLIGRKIEVLGILEEIATNAIEGGSGKLSNVLLIQRKKEELRSRIKELEVEKKYFSIRINHAIGRQPDIPVIPETINQNSWDSAVLVDQEFVETSHPMLKTLHNTKTVSEKAIELTDYASKPKVMVGLEYAMVSSRPNIEILNNGRDIVMPMGTVTIPIHRKQYEAKRQEERIRINTVDASIRDTKNNFYAEISQANALIEESEIIINKNNDLKIITESTIELMRIEYINDGSRFEELLRLEMEQIQYDIEIEIARKQKRIALASLERFRT